jgi:hypothetical protein
MPKVFILDDSWSRIALLTRYVKERVTGAEITVADTADDAKKFLLEGQPWHQIYLDHDLGGQTFQNSNEQNTGYQVALFLIEKKIDFSMAIIHSLNPGGAERMLQVLGSKAVRIPISLLI